MTHEDGRWFVFEACLGRGGFGEVYRARLRRASGFETLVAVKLLRPDVDPGSQAAQRLRDEARVLGLLRHRSIPGVHDLVVLDGRLALVSEYVEGADLSRCLRDPAPMPQRAVVEVALAVADALHAAYHATTPSGPARIVHRDLKPANVRVARDGTPKLLDFGIAFTEAVTRVAETQTAAVVGSPVYMAPERFDGGPPEPSVDVFALGAVLFEGLARARLFHDHTFQTLAGLALFRQRFDDVVARRFEALPADVPPALRDLLRSMLAFDPDVRPSALEVVHALEAMVPELPGPALATWCRQRSWPAEAPQSGGWVGRTVEEGVRRTDEAPLAAAPSPLWHIADVPTLATPELSLLPTTQDSPPELDSAWVRPLRPRRAGVAVLLVAGTVLAAGLAVLGLTARPEPPPPSVGTLVSPPPVAAVPQREAPPPQPAPAPAATGSVGSSPPSVAPSPVLPRPRVVAVPRVEHLLPEPAPAAAPVAAPHPEPLHAAAPTEQVPPPVVPEPRPTPPPPAGALVSVDPRSGSARVWVRTPDGLVVLPARLPVGTYTVLAADVAGHPQVAGSIDVPAGGSVSVRCAMGLCRGGG